MTQSTPARGLAGRPLSDFFRSLRSSRLAEARLAEQNPHLAAAIATEKMEGQRIATFARTVALAVVAVLVLWTNPRFEVLYYEAIIVVFVAIGFAQLRAARVGQSGREIALILVDLALLAVIFAAPNPLAQVEWPTAVQFRFGGFIYYFIFLAGATLAYSWRTVQSIGVWVAVVWLAGVLGVVFFGRTLPELSVRTREALAGYDRVFELVDPNSIEFSVRIQEVTVFLIVAAILGLRSRRTSDLVVRQANLAAERANLSRYLPPSMVEELAHRDEPMGGIRSQKVAVLFADIVGFSGYAERSKPEDVILLLRSFHAALEEAVFAHSGTLDKYLGDGVMACFGTPTPSVADADNAVAAAFAMQDSIARLNDTRTAAGLSTITLSVGIHYGAVILGDIGNARRMEFATLGDTVNVAARLESATRILACRIVASDDLLNAIPDPAARARRTSAMRLRENIPVRGRTETLNVWTA